MILDLVFDTTFDMIEDTILKYMIMNHDVELRKLRNAIKLTLNSTNGGVIGWVIFEYPRVNLEAFA